MKKIIYALALVFSVTASAQDMNEKLKPLIEEAKKWAADATIVAAVKKANTTPAAAYKDMNQDKWKALKVMDPLVRDLTKTAAAEALKKLKSEKVSEGFISAADGTKVGFLAKTSNWSHKGKPKHDDPMAGKVWIGKVETDESTGVQQVQFAVPILDGGKAIGSLVIGVAVSKL